MKALTICQPYAHLICLPPADPRHKRVENRTWDTSYRGDLLIHAGKSRQWLEVSDDGLSDEEYDIPLSDLAFGAAVAVARLIDCVSIGKWAAGRAMLHDSVSRRYPWLADHQHAEGPVGWVLADVRPLASPIPWPGSQGLWNAPGHLQDLVNEQLEGILR